MTIRKVLYHVCLNPAWSLYHLLLYACSSLSMFCRLVITDSWPPSTTCLFMKLQATPTWDSIIRNTGRTHRWCSCKKVCWRTLLSMPSAWMSMKNTKRKWEPQLRTSIYSPLYSLNWRKLISVRSSSRKLWRFSQLGLVVSYQRLPWKMGKSSSLNY